MVVVVGRPGKVVVVVVVVDGRMRVVVVVPSPRFGHFVRQAARVDRHFTAAGLQPSLHALKASRAAVTQVLSPAHWPPAATQSSWHVLVHCLSVVWAEAAHFAFLATQVAAHATPLPGEKQFGKAVSYSS